MTEALQPIGKTTFGKPENAGNVLLPDEAQVLLNTWVENDRLRKHMRQVAEIMKQWALQRENTSEAVAYQWYLAGLLHDADWEKHPMEHCRIIVEELEKRNVDAAVIRCIASHSPRYFGIEPESAMDKMIYAFDELSGFVHAVSLMRPDGYTAMEVKSVMKKLKDKGFAAQVSRDDIVDALNRIEISLEEIISFIIENQRTVL